MLNKIAQTFASKIFAGVFNLLTIILTARFLGAEGRGTASLIITSIAIIMVLSNLVGGTVLVYLSPRHRMSELIAPSILWAVTMSIAGTFLLSGFNLINKEYIPHIFILTIINSLSSNNLMILLGKENIKANNLLGLLQSFTILIVVLVSFYFLKYFEVKAYVTGLYFSYLSVLIVSSILVSKYFDGFKNIRFKDIFLKMLRYGFLVQLSAALSLLTYRMSYYMIEAHEGRAGVGIFSVGVSLSEAIWLLGNSIAMNLFSKVANTEDKQISQDLTVRLTRFSLAATFVILLPLLLMPSFVFKMVFGEGFEKVHSVILCLGPGILFYNLNIVLNHYFSGTGKYRICTQAAALGFTLVLVLNYFLIPAYGIYGAGAASSLAYILMGLYQGWVFKKDSGVRWRDFIITSADLILVFSYSKKWLGR